MNEREETVLVLGFAAVDFVNQHRLGFPDGGRGFDVTDASTLFLRPGKTDQIVEGDEARVVVTVFQLQRLRETVEQECFSRAGLADQEQGITADQSRDDDRFDRVVTVNAELSQESGLHFSHSNPLRPKWP